MRVFVALVGAVAAFAVPVAARALPEAGFAAVASLELTSGLAATDTTVAERSPKVSDVTADVFPAGASPDTYYCGYVYSEHGLRGDNVPLEVNWDTHTDGHFRSYIMSGKCDCEFRGEGVGNQENSIHIKGPGQGELPWDAWFFFCQFFGSTKRDHVEDVAVAVSPPSPDHDEATYCGYAYTETGLRGENVALRMDLVIQNRHTFKSYIMTGECLCTFHTGKDGGEGPLENIKGPGQGNLAIESFRVYCVQDGFKKIEGARDLVALTLAPAPAQFPRSDDRIPCGYVYTEPNLQGRKNSLAAGKVTGFDTFKSYIIKDDCICEFRPIPMLPLVEIIKGPAQGNLSKAARQVECRQKRFKQGKNSKGLVTSTLAPAPAPRSDDTISCGYVYTEFDLQGRIYPLAADQVVRWDNFRSYTVSSDCICMFFSRPAAYPDETIEGLAQGNLAKVERQVSCRRDGFKGESPEDLVASTLAPAPAPRSDDTIYCGYAYTAPNLRGQKYDLAADAVVQADNTFRSYIISGECKCDFFPYHEDHPSETIKGPTQGNLLKEAREVWCRQDGSKKHIQGPAARGYIAP